ncbi:hypothetical protein DOTSEDRAFT_80593 [Dothistroma septosporum NZE10]|uniref:C2H2-type domain-containing protein n=1 Tax=Dothistroma septosporum (strain NZE10 / CBS 128990) TaxID=675120 RepID=M2WLZ8_DOTSN|nr:hypothetical protein DOTSEDRAFT_80593 [Dothistroma septosporum NZE10]
MPRVIRFECQARGCGRSFSRQEHLQRHVLNHSDTEYTCERCRTVFKRPDLLERHITRHRVKDAEGKSLMTRKRLWKDEEGNVVNKRPAKQRPSAIASSVDQVSCYPPSPSGSSSDQATSPNGITLQAQQSTVPDCTDTQLPALAFDNVIDDSFFFWDNSFSAAYEPGITSVQFDDIFMPDTASSFNMPYTTMSNYNWLFDLGLDPAQNSSIPASQSMGYETVEQQVATLPMKKTVHKSASAGASDTPMNDSTVQSTIDPGGVIRRDSYFSHTSISPVQLAGQNHHSAASTPKRLPGARENPLGSLKNEMALPRLDDLAHERFLDLIELCRPALPDGTVVSFDNPLISRTSLQSYLDSFFTRFNPVYPLIHMPTFATGNTEPLLLASIIILGATYASKEAHQLAVCIHDVLRPHIFADPKFNAKPELWVLQAILLTECLGKSRGGQKQHDMSHLFHGLLINLIRRSDCQATQPEQSTFTTEGDIESAWRSWARLEEMKRLAQLCFMWDVQHAVLFSQSLCMSAFELRSTLPCDQNIWEAASAAQWQKTLESQLGQPQLLLTVLKAYLTPRTAARRPHLNAFSRVVVLHGLMSISWDMTRRDQTSLGVIGGSTINSSWRDRMTKAYRAWSTDFDAYCAMARSGTENQRYRDSLDTFFTAYNGLYHAAQLILLAEVLDLQIYAGARHILGRPVTKIDYSRSQKNVKQWANVDKDDAALASWHAAHIMKSVTDDRKDQISTAEIFHQPWILYLATLTIWSFYRARPSSVVALAEDEDEMIWDVQAEMKELVIGMITVSPLELETRCIASGKRSTIAATAVIVKHLSKIRWGLVHDGMLVLKGLVPWRLINDDKARV